VKIANALGSRFNSGLPRTERFAIGLIQVQHFNPHQRSLHLLLRTYPTTQSHHSFFLKSPVRQRCPLPPLASRWAQWHYWLSSTSCSNSPKCWLALSKGIRPLQQWPTTPKLSLQFHCAGIKHSFKIPRLFIKSCSCVQRESIEIFTNESCLLL
jgi:hypothetical protein